MAVVDEYSTEYWYRNGMLHREDGPAVIYADGTEFWYCRDQPHHEDGPATVYINSICCWYRDGIRYTPVLVKI